MCYEEKETIDHMWNGCGKMRKRKRKDKLDERDMEKERQNGKR
jgi:hypothetical protein